MLSTSFVYRHRTPHDDPLLSLGCVNWYTKKDLNFRLLPCHGSTLPLSYWCMKMARPLSNDLRTSILEIGILPIKLQTHKINVDSPGWFYETFDGYPTLLRIKMVDSFTCGEAQFHKTGEVIRITFATASTTLHTSRNCWIRHNESVSFSAHGR